MNIIEEVEIFVKPYYNKISKVENYDYWRNHILLARKYVLELVKLEKVDSVVVEIAILLHDVGKIYGRENHAENSEKIAKEFLSKFNIEKDKLNLILKCIKKHSVQYAEEENEIKIIQAADGLSRLYDNRWEDYIKNNRITQEKTNKKFERNLKKINLESARKIALKRIEYLKSLF